MLRCDGARPFGLHVGRGGTEHESINRAGEHRSRNWHYPKQPKLLYGPPADKQRRTRTARGIDGRVGDRDAREMYES